MCTYKADEDMSNCKFNHYYQSILVPFDVKHIVLIAHIVCSREVYLYVRQISPFSSLCNIIPSLKGRLSISMSFRTIELHQFPM